MPDESAADDGAIYDVWDRFTLDEVRTAFQRLEALWRALIRLRGHPPPAPVVDEARALVDGDYPLAHIAWLAELAAR